MRVSLLPDPAEFVKQIADTRRFLNRLEQRGGQEAVTARFLSSLLVPYLNMLRAELRHADVNPQQVMTAVSEVMGNLASSMIQSMFDAPIEARQEALDRVMQATYANAMMTFERDARVARDVADDAAAKKKPKLSIVKGD